MATISVANTTFITRNVALGNTYEWTGEYAATTAAGSDTVATPLTVVNSVTVSWALSASTAPTTVHYLSAAVSTLSGSILVWNSTHDNFSVRYTVRGR